MVPVPTHTPNAISIPDHSLIRAGTDSLIYSLRWPEQNFIVRNPRKAPIRFVEDCKFRVGHGEKVCIKSIGSYGRRELEGKFRNLHDFS